MNSVELDNVSFKYGTSQISAIKDISFSCSRGDIIGIIGSTGSGKSTLCYTLNGLIPGYLKGKFSGTVIIGGKNTLEMSVGDLSRKVALLFQEPDFQVSSSTVISELAFGMQNVAVPRKKMIEDLARITDELGINHLISKEMASLSTGEKQLVILAALLVLRPDILVLDEPVSMLDTANTTRLHAILQAIARRGTTVLIIDHNLEFLLTAAERIIGLKNGKIVVDGPSKDILLDKKVLKSLELTTSPYLELLMNLCPGVSDMEGQLKIKAIKEKYSAVFDH